MRMASKTRDQEERWGASLEPESYVGLEESTKCGAPAASEPMLPQEPPTLSLGGRLISPASSLWHVEELFEEVLLVLYDPSTGLMGAAIIDVVDSRLRPELARGEPMRCADLAVQGLVRALSGHGGSPSTWVATLVGGACEEGADSMFHKGHRLQSMLMRLLDRHGVGERRCDLGGTQRRSCVMDAGALHIHRGSNQAVVSCMG